MGLKCYFTCVNFRSRMVTNVSMVYDADKTFINIISDGTENFEIEHSIKYVSDYSIIESEEDQDNSAEIN